MNLRRLSFFTAFVASVAGCSWLVGSDNLASTASQDDASPSIDGDTRGDVTSGAEGAVDAATDAGPDVSVPPRCLPDASFAADPANCGACGHDCLGGTCKDSKCAPLVLTSGQAGTHWLSVDATTVYWTNGTSIHACPKSGCGGASATSIVAARNGISEVLAGAGRVFWTECVSAVGGAYSCPAGGCTGAPTVMSEGYGCLSGLAIDEANSLFYYGSSTFTRVLRCPLDACSYASSSAIAIDMTGYVESMTLVNGLPYWLQAQLGLTTCNAPNCVPSGAHLMAQCSRNAFSPPSVAGGFAYWATYLGGPDQKFNPGEISQIVNTGAVLRAPLSQDGGSAEIINSSGAATAAVADDAGVRFTDFLGGTILSCPPTGCDAGVSVAALGQGKPFSLVQDETAIYWGNWGDGRIMKLAK